MLEGLECSYQDFMGDPPGKQTRQRSPLPGGRVMYVRSRHGKACNPTGGDIYCVRMPDSECTSHVNEADKKPVLSCLARRGGDE